LLEGNLVRAVWIGPVGPTAEERRALLDAGFEVAEVVGELPLTELRAKLREAIARHECGAVVGYPGVEFRWYLRQMEFARGYNPLAGHVLLERGQRGWLSTGAVPVGLPDMPE
jgi:hypothetical protein